MPDRPRIVIAGWAGAGNAGDELLTAWAADAVTRAGGAPVVLSVDADDTVARHGVPAVRATGLAAVRELWRADGLLVGPGGILQDATSVWSLPAHASRPLIARLRRRPIAAAGIGVGPLRRRGSSRLVRTMLGSATGVVVRDRPSARLLERSGIDSVVAPDAVFGRCATSRTPDSVVVALRAGLAPGGLRIARSREDDGSGLEPWADAAAAVAGSLGVPVRFAALDAGRDLAIHERLADRVGGEVVVVDETSAPETLASAGVALCGRYHAAVLALGAGRPVVAVDEGMKLPALAEMFPEGFATRPRDVAAEAIEAACRSVLADAAALPPLARRAQEGAAGHDRAVEALVAAARSTRR